MSATLSATSTVASQSLAEWVRLFPRQVTETYTSSVTFMKQLTVVAVSTITYLKNVFPEESYTIEKFGGVKLRILKKKCRDELAQFVSTALTQAFEAFDKKYLHQLALCFYDGECDAANLVEYHIFEFTYNTDGVALSVHSKNRDNVVHSSKYAFDHVKERTIHLIRACVVIMQTCQSELPDSFDISLRLYYNEEAPEGYQAPGFVSTAEPEDHLAPTVGDSVKLGWVQTPFHRLVARTYFRDNVTSSHEANASQSTPMMTQNEGEELCSGEGAGAGAGARGVRCPCRKHAARPDAALALLTCEYCHTAQHAACFGVRGAAARRVARHCCAACADADPRRAPTDLRLAALPDDKRECLCIFRRTLEWCSRAPSVCARMLADMFGLSLSNAAKLMKLLHSHGIVEQDQDSDLATPLKIIPEQVNEVMSKYFQAEESDVVDRLVAETLSQGSQPDPVGEVLGTMEKVSLQQATAMGKIVDHTPPDIAVEDPTLKQYREALLSSDKQTDEQLPLSGTHNPVKDMENIGKKPNKRKAADKEPRQLRSGVKTKRAKAHD